MLTPPLDSSQFSVRNLALMNDICHNDIERRDTCLNQLNELDGLGRAAYLDALLDPRPFIVRGAFDSLAQRLDQAEAQAEHAAAVAAATTTARNERDELQHRVRQLEEGATPMSDTNTPTPAEAPPPAQPLRTKAELYRAIDGLAGTVDVDGQDCQLQTPETHDLKARLDVTDTSSWHDGPVTQDGDLLNG